MRTVDKTEFRGPRWSASEAWGVNYGWWCRLCLVISLELQIE